ncbi:Na(+)/H(+) antiporter subunit B [Alkalilimnicola ehrlichii]|uniref:Na(+)/H(+) antiporter subunit B n=1 Tax=Alkalilimnicola ehrlichii TaxID=351052 RepID=A0A3E0X0W7_9GAMM|nr:Na+/H+ antiporter subunit B [Alkalilimnicola ehrlichii]RFA30364.1 Na(+)/H(+) antiporter subunit B [Alkalilimnicola ehrlichii]RFA37936.1 Na(+)/H(+) antiporter subunit B [Alkalilimnicola ehrlichii]
MTSMPSLILSTAARVLLPLLVLFSIFLLLRGHDLPGGGFIGGLVGASGYTLYLFAFDSSAARAALRMDPRTMVGLGLVIATLSGVIGTFVRGEPFFTSQWWEVYVPIFGEMKLSSPLIFDLGVYMVVLGSVMTIVLTLAEAEE